MTNRALSAAVLLAASLSTPVAAQQEADALPAAVRQWLEADQLQRWAQLVQAGDSLFNHGSCTRCHREGGVGGERAPDLTDTRWDHSDGSLGGIFETIFWGVRRKDFKDPNRPFEMNPTGGMNLSWNQVRAVAAYVWTLSNGNFLPRRR